MGRQCHRAPQLKADWVGTNLLQVPLGRDIRPCKEERRRCLRSHMRVLHSTLAAILDEEKSTFLPEHSQPATSAASARTACREMTGLAFWWLYYLKPTPNGHHGHDGSLRAAILLIPPTLNLRASVTAAMLKPVSFLRPDASSLHSTRPICVRSCRQASHTAPRRHTQGFSYQSLAHCQPVSQPRSAEDE
ncbi:unnamed protein product [Leuciscus chuanchicus]